MIVISYNTRLNDVIYIYIYIHCIYCFLIRSEHHQSFSSECDPIANQAVIQCSMNNNDAVMMIISVDQK